MGNIAGLSYGFSSAKAKAVLGYDPLYSVDEGLQKTVALFMAAKSAASAA